MASGDEWVLGAMQTLLPPDYWQFLARHALDPDAPVQVLRRKFVSQASHLATEMYPLVEPFINRAISALYSSPDVVILAFVLVVLFIALKLLNLARRIMLFWTRIAIRAAMWAVVVALVAFVWQRGIERSARDSAILAGKLAGYAVVIKDIWLREYRDWEAQTAARDAAYMGSQGGR
ncbi:hypothetical protein RB595_005435 [Gaeumannomyces hyphopodioides]